MNDKPEVIVWCATYNHEEYIRSALDGFVMQKTNFRFEVIVHDDASTDKTADIIREYEAKYPSLFNNIYQTENQYSKKASPRRRFTESTDYWKYIAICEGDDYWTDPLKLQKQYDFMEAHPEYTACTHEAIQVNVSTGETHKFTRGLKTGDISFGEIVLWNNNPRRVPQTASFFMQKEFSLPPQWMVVDHCGDYPTMLNCAMCGKVYFMEDVMSVYRYKTKGSWTSKITDKFIYNHSNNLIEVLTRLDRETGYKHTDEIFWGIVYQKYAQACSGFRFKMISYDSYKGTTRRYAWKLTMSIPIGIAKRIAAKILPKPIVQLIRRIRRREQYS